MNNKLPPVFIHSLFRSGSTYLFNAFRRSPAGYTAYQEPLNPELNFMATNPEKVLVHHHATSKLMRHPQLDKPYFYEFYLLAEEVGRLFRKEFSYDQYFISDSDEISELKAYFSALIGGSQGTPVFQCCRSTGRVKRCRTECGGTHIFLWRNPWDQWWSYRIGFDIHNLLIANAANPPVFLKHLRQDLSLPEFHHPDVFQEYDYYRKRPMDSRQSYTLFYALWCHAMLEAMPFCDISINIERLGTSVEYREHVLSQLEAHGIDDLDFSDCEIPVGIYGKADSAFFNEIEGNVHDLLTSSGYSGETIENMQQTRLANLALLEPGKLQEAAIRDASRARETVRHYESQLHQVSADLQESESDRAARLDQIHQYDTWLKASQADVQTLQTDIQTLQAAAQAYQAELQKIKSSFVYKIGRRLGMFS